MKSSVFTMDRAAVFLQVKKVGVIPAMRASDPEQATRACKAIGEGGLTIVEVSLAPARALEVLEAVVSAHRGMMVVGAGSVIDAEGATLAIKAGAQFIVTPGFSLEAIEVSLRLGVAIFAGAITPTEVQIAARSGADAVKLFPCYSMGGPRYLRSLCGQFPQMDFIASGGVSLQNCTDYVRAGACAIGVGGDIIDAESMAAGDHRVFRQRAKRFREAMTNARLVSEPSLSMSAGENR